MNRTIAFLRAINVTNRYVKMDVLGGIFRDMGFSGVDTYITSGNIIFDTPDEEPETVASVIEETLAERLGFDVPTMLRSSEELNAIATNSPFPHDELLEGETLYVTFLRHVPPAGAAERLATANSAIDDLHLLGREVYWLRHRNLGESRLTNARLEKLVNTVATNRNMNTVQRLIKKYHLT